MSLVLRNSRKLHIRLLNTTLPCRFLGSWGRSFQRVWSFLLCNFLFIYLFIHLFISMVSHCMQFITERFSATDIATLQALGASIVVLLLDYAIFLKHTLLTLTSLLRFWTSSCMASTSLVCKMRVTALVTKHYSVRGNALFNVLNGPLVPLVLWDRPWPSSIVLSNAKKYSNSAIQLLSFRRRHCISLSLQFQKPIKIR